MTTLADNKVRPFEQGAMCDYPMIASDTIYEGAAVGLVPATGHAQPLTATDRFVGFASAPAVNGATAAAVNVNVYRSGSVELPVTGAVISDVGQPIYATDDDTFVFSPVGGAFVGIVRRFVSSGVVVVEFGPQVQDPYARWSVREAVATAETLAAADCGKLIWVTADAGVVTLPAVAAALSGVAIVNGGAFGTVLVTVTPNASDLIRGPGITAEDVKSVLNTKATARRGDMIVLGAVDAAGYTVTELVGTWARQA
jgi:hypothetical protein